MQNEPNQQQRKEEKNNTQTGNKFMIANKTLSAIV